MAARPSAAFEGLDQRAAQHVLERGQVAQEFAATLAQRGGRNILQNVRTRLITGPTILSDCESWINARRGATQYGLNQLCQRDQTRSINDYRLDAGCSPHVRSCPVGPLADHGEAAEVGVAQAQRLDA
jgi:hypothetical protein